MTVRNIYIVLVLLSVWLSACDRPECQNDNPIFNTHEPDSKAYKDELVRQLKTIEPSTLTYWLQKYDDQNGEESLYFHIQGGDLCAILHLTMNDWNKLEHVRKNKGIGRRGAEFTNLQFEVMQNASSTQFVYTTYDRMID